MDVEVYLNRIPEAEVFDRSYINGIIEESGKTTSANILNHTIEKLIKAGLIIRIGRNKYKKADGKKCYSYDYSDLSMNIADCLAKEHPYMDFRIFEIIQLNKFINHQIAHNTVFVSVEDGLEEYVFSTLRGEYTGNLMVNPNIDDFYRYRVEDMIVINKLPTESLKGKTCFWNTRLEKMLVDIVTDKLMISMIPESEYANIYEEAFERYIIEYSALKRYANRRGALKKLRNVIEEYTDIKPEDIGI